MLSPNDLFTPVSTPDALHAWLELFLGLRVPRVAVCAGHDAPFDYLQTAYFEPARDQVVWAPRGGGKTRLAAAATLLDLLHKPGVQVRILGGSLEQAMKMWDYLLPDAQRLAAAVLAGKPRGRTLALAHGGRAAVLAQSERAVRGLRVQKLRCDEVELFKPHIWEAAQLTTRSLAGRRPVAGSIEALSTLHTPFGLMSRVVDEARAAGRRTVRWCLLEVLERCPPQRACGTCPLWEDCRGVAKSKCDGWVSVDDAVRLKQRVSLQTWQSEMLCRRPGVNGCVFPGFDVERHVRETLETQEDDASAAGGGMRLGVDFGFANPFVALWVRVTGHVHHVVDEYVQEQRTIEEHVAELKARPWPAPAFVACDPAGAARSSHTAASEVGVLRRHGYRVRCCQSRINEGLELIRTALTPAAGEPTLYVHPRCRRLIRALQAYRYAAGGSELPVKDGTHDHLVDALRYHFVNMQPAGPAAGGRY